MVFGKTSLGRKETKMLQCGGKIFGRNGEETALISGLRWIGKLEKFKHYILVG